MQRFNVAVHILRRYLGVGSAWVVAAPWLADILGLKGLPVRLVVDLAGECSAVDVGSRVHRVVPHCPAMRC